MRFSKIASVCIASLLIVGAMTGEASADLVISKNKTSNVDCEAGICNATAADAVLNTKDLANMLATSDVKVFAEGPATDITVSAPFSWTSTHKLTLGAYGSLNVKDVITVAGTSGLTIATNVASTGGVFRLVGIGKISLWDTNSTLVINNTTYTLINNLPALISAIATNPSGTYAFANDYNAAQDGSYLQSPIQTIFTGVLEGLGNSISNYKIYNSAGPNDKVALFYQIGAAGQLSDLNVADASIQTHNALPAILVGVNQGIVSHSSVTGSISALVGSNVYSAGMVFDNQGVITRSHATVSMTEDIGAAAGLAAYNEGTISLSYASGSVSAQSEAGGLVAVSSGTITDSYAQGDVSVLVDNNEVAGGLVGYSSGTIQRSFATGDVMSEAAGLGRKKSFSQSKTPLKSVVGQLGGLVGVSAGAIAYSYATGSVSGTFSDNEPHGSAGGLVGCATSNGTLSTSTILQSYALGKLSFTNRKHSGGVIGFDDTTQGNKFLFWDFDTTAVSNPSQGAGNVANDKGLKGYSDKKFRKAVIHDFDPAVWGQSASINNGYPYLLSNPPQ